MKITANLLSNAAERITAEGAHKRGCDEWTIPKSAMVRHTPKTDVISGSQSFITFWSESGLHVS